MYRVIVLGRDGKDVLVVPGGVGLTLPFVEIPRWQRVAENLTAAVRTEWGEEVICLFEPDDLAGTDGTERHYQAAEHWCATGTPKAPTRWVPISALSDGSLTASDYLATQRSIAQSEAEGHGSPAGQFARLGWFKELSQWIEEVIHPLGFHLTGNFNQLNASPSFSLIRFETDGPAVWFKAVGEPNQREFTVTCLLAQLFPEYLPGILRRRPDWNGWLSREASGKLLSDVQEQVLWEQASASLAKLQIQSIDRGSQILGTGARDLGSAALSKLIQPFMSVIAQLMERQTKVPPPILDRKDLSALADSLQSAVDATKAIGIPETVGHLDLNPGNIIVSDNRCAFLDWAEAYVGNPLFSLEYLLQHARLAFRADATVKTRLVAAYCSQWDGVISRTAIAGALAFAPLLAAFAHAVGNGAWAQSEMLQEPRIAGYFRSLARRMHCEAESVADRGPLCLH